MKKLRTDKQHHIYLAGAITSDLRTYEWREKFTNLVLTKDIPVTILNPCETSFNQDMKKYILGGGKNFFEEANSRFPIGVLPGKDFQMVKISTLVVANFSLINQEKPSIGTVVEVNWAREAKIPVIAIVDENFSLGKLYSRHPFISWAISERVFSVDEAVDLVERFFVLSF